VFGPRTYSIVNISHKICNSWLRAIGTVFAWGKAYTWSLFGPVKKCLYSGLLLPLIPQFTCNLSGRLRGLPVIGGQAPMFDAAL
jgi:hypothetical protein